MKSDLAGARGVFVISLLSLTLMLAFFAGSRIGLVCLWLGFDASREDKEDYSRDDQSDCRDE